MLSEIMVTLENRSRIIGKKKKVVYGGRGRNKKTARTHVMVKNQYVLRLARNLIALVYDC